MKRSLVTKVLASKFLHLQGTYEHSQGMKILMKFVNQFHFTN